jgi:hypothetical protein
MVQVRFVHWASGRVAQRTPVPQTQNATHKKEFSSLRLIRCWNTNHLRIPRNP